MSGKRNVSVCRGHELANALYVRMAVNPLWSGLGNTHGFEPDGKAKSNLHLLLIMHQLSMPFKCEDNNDGFTEHSTSQLSRVVGVVL